MLSACGLPCSRRNNFLIPSFAGMFHVVQVDVISMVLFYLQRHEVFKSGSQKSRRKRTAEEAFSQISTGKCTMPLSPKGLSAAAESLLQLDDEETEVIAEIDRQRRRANDIACRSETGAPQTAADVVYGSPAEVYTVLPPGPQTSDNDSDEFRQGTATSRNRPIEGRTVDINLASALTHVGGDSMRTLAVFISAVIASCGEDADLTDAWATTVVTFSIVCMVLPLSQEIYKSSMKGKKSTLDGGKHPGGSPVYRKLYTEGYASSPLHQQQQQQLWQPMENADGVTVV
jgi:Co/Zn/Cd efflux system component